MKKNNKIIMAGILGTVTLASIGTASAHLGNSESREAIKAAIESKSYSTFTEVATDSKIAETIDTEDKFNKLTQAHELKESGDVEGSKAIKEKLGLKNGRGGKDPAVRAAVEANDYAAFQVATEGKSIAEKIDSPEKFAQLVEIHTLREAGDKEGAKALKEELGIGHGDRDGKRDRGQSQDQQ